MNDPPEDEEDNLTDRKIRIHKKKKQLSFDPTHRKSPFLSTRIQLKNSDLFEYNERLIKNMQDRE